MATRNTSTLFLHASWMIVQSIALGLAACGPDLDGETGPGAADLEETAADELVCQPATDDLDPRRSLFVTDVNVLQGADFSLHRTLKQLADQSDVPGLTALDLFRQLWDTQNPGPGLGLGPHCDDQVINGRPSLNHYPIECGRAEGRQADVSLDEDGITPEEYLAAYHPIALVNRFDRAPADGSHCGEYRIVYAKDPNVGPGRNLIIFEAQLPNRSSSCGLAACRPIQGLWASLTKIDDPAIRARRLERFFFRGGYGFPAVIKIEHLANGAGQIRTNQFMQRPWTLREFNLAWDRSARSPGVKLEFVPAFVKNNAFPMLFNGAIPTTTSSYAKYAGVWHQDFAGQVASLAGADLRSIGLSTPDQCGAGESIAHRDWGYRAWFDRDGGHSPFRSELQKALTGIGSTLTPAHIIKRAEAQSCAGCHDLSNGADLGGGLTWPSSLRFVHTDERRTEMGRNGPRFPISPALEDEFLPQRVEIMQRFLSDAQCARCTPVRWNDLARHRVH